MHEDETAASAPESWADVSLLLKCLGGVALVGLGFLIAGSLFLALNLNYILHGEATTGVVVDYRVGYARRHGKTYAPIVAYAVGGEQYEITGSVGSKAKMYQLRQEVPILYLPDDHSSAVIGDFAQLYLFPTIFGGFGGVCLAAAGVATAWVVHKSGWLRPRLT